MLTVALQGHTYRHRFTGRKLMAMSTGGTVEAYEMDESRPWPLAEKTWAHAEHLEPLPMTYFGGAVPQEVAP